MVEGLDITTPGAASTFLNGGSNGMIIAFTDSSYCRLTRSRIHPSGPVAERDWIVIVGRRGPPQPDRPQRPRAGERRWPT